MTKVQPKGPIAAAVIVFTVMTLSDAIAHLTFVPKGVALLFSVGLVGLLIEIIVPAPSWIQLSGQSCENSNETS